MSSPEKKDWTLAMPRSEFIAIMACLMAINALAIDVMLPGLQMIGEALGEADENRRQLVIGGYLLGFGAGQILFGPLADRFGRRGPLMIGVGIYVLAAIGSLFAPDFNTLLILRLVQGFAAASSRVLVVAIVRDVASGRQMARIMSLVMMIFLIMPVVAPTVGQLILFTGHWQGVFLFMALLGGIVLVWTALRLPETLHVEDRIDLSLGDVARGFRTVLTTRVAIWYTLALTAMMSALFGFISSVQQIAVGLYHLGDWFPLIFASIALVGSAAALTNASLVERLGMRRLSHAGIVAFIGTSFLLSLVSQLGLPPFMVLYLLFALSFFALNIMMANFGAIAIEPLGAIAGSASSVQGFIQLTIASLLGARIGLSFDGTVVPISIAFLSCGLAALVFCLIAERGRLFQEGAGAPPAPAAVEGV